MAGALRRKSELSPNFQRFFLLKRRALRLPSRIPVFPPFTNPHDQRGPAVCHSLHLITACLLLTAPALAAEPAKWQSLLKEIDPGRDAVAGSWQVVDSGLRVNAVTGGRLALPVTAPAEYDLRVTFTRQTGSASIGLVVLQGGHQVAFEVDAWGSHLAGFQNIGGETIRTNSSRKK